jgi:hypothetical protein
MYDVSFTKDKEALDITIYNLYPDLELVSPIYCGNGTTFHVSPIQQTDTGNTMEASFGIYPKQENVKGAFLYKLKGKHTDRTGNQLNSSTALIEDTATSVYLLVVWDITYYSHKICACVIECADDFTWDEDKLWALCHQSSDQFYKQCNRRIITWLIHGDAVIKIRREVVYGSDYKLNIILSEGTGKYDMKEPIKYNLERSVMPLSIMIVLMYMVSLFIQSTFKLNIHNQCLNIDLVSPVYYTGDNLECHRPPGHKVYAKDTMRSSFIIKSGGVSYVALIYKLQRKQSHEFTEIIENISSVTQLLLIWKFSKFKKLCADVLLVGHGKGFD